MATFVAWSISASASTTPSAETCRLRGPLKQVVTGGVCATPAGGDGKVLCQQRAPCRATRLVSIPRPRIGCCGPFFHALIDRIGVTPGVDGAAAYAHAGGSATNREVLSPSIAAASCRVTYLQALTGDALLVSLVAPTASA